MYNDYYTSASGGFTDEARLHDLLLTTILGASLIFVCVLIATLCAFVAFRRALRHGTDISDRLDQLSKAISAAGTGSQADLDAHAQAVLEADEAAFGRFNAFAKLLETQTKDLSKALSPTAEREETAEDRKRRHGAGQVGGNIGNTGTVINIAVNQSGQIVPPASDGHSVAEAVEASKETSFPLTRTARLWLALQKLAELWRDKVLIRAYYQSAQTQLFRAEGWSSPDDLTLRFEQSLRSGHKTHVS